MLTYESIFGEITQLCPINKGNFQNGIILAAELRSLFATFLFKAAIIPKVFVPLHP